MINSGFVQKDQLPKLYEIVEMKLYPHTVKQMQGLSQHGIETTHNRFMEHLNNKLFKRFILLLIN